MALTARIRNWLAQFRKYYFTYSEGFYHFPYNGNSPETLVDSFKGLPFVKHSPERQCVTTATPLMDGGFHYQKLEEGCWLVYSRMRYKANVAFDLIYEDTRDSDYYMLSLNNVANSVRVHTPTYDGHVCFPTYSWTFFKPKEQHCSVNFKGDDSRFITLFFNETWLQNNLASSQLFEEASLPQFMKSEEGYIVWPLPDQEVQREKFAMFEKIMIVDADARPIDLLQLKYNVLNLIFEFFKLCKAQDVVHRYQAIGHSNEFSLGRVANYLNSHLFDKFPGIDALADKFGISKSKFKEDFKQLFGKPVYQYFQEQQMQLAKTLLLDQQGLVKELAFKFGYESPSKFSAAFKKCHGILPSELFTPTKISATCREPAD